MFRKLNENDYTKTMDFLGKDPGLNLFQIGDIENYGNNGKGPVWWYPMEKMYSDDNRLSDIELDKIKDCVLILKTVKELKGSVI